MTTVGAFWFHTVSSGITPSTFSLPYLGPLGFPLQGISPCRTPPTGLSCLLDWLLKHQGETDLRDKPQRISAFSSFGQYKSLACPVRIRVHDQRHESPRWASLGSISETVHIVWNARCLCGKCFWSYLKDLVSYGKALHNDVLNYSVNVRINVLKAASLNSAH